MRERGSGGGSRAIRVRVSDEEEPPGTPGAPVVTPGGHGQLEGELERTGEPRA